MTPDAPDPAGARTLAREMLDLDLGACSLPAVNAAASVDSVVALGRTGSKRGLGNGA